VAEITRSIGLSLGADICWAGCYEELVQKLQLALPINEDNVRFQISRVAIEPFNLRQPCRYDVVIDRLTHWLHTTREWIKKAVIMDGLYVLNNPWSIQSMEKHTSYVAMMKLGMPIPETWMVPPKEPCDHADTSVTLRRYARLFDLNKVGEQVGYPLFIKPFDGGAWVGVSRVDNGQELIDRYNESGSRIMHLQRAVHPFDLFVRGVGIGPQVTTVLYNPDAPLHARYVPWGMKYVPGQSLSRSYAPEDNALSAEDTRLIEDTVLTINGFFNWEFNSCEALRQDGTFYPIDFANACPDFQVTSLHCYFPQMVKHMLRWSLFCAATKRPMQPNLSWEPYFKVAARDLPYRERLAGYAAITRERMQADAFTEFCDKHLSHLDEVALDFFGSTRAKDIFRLKVAALFPAHEVETFTDHYWGLVQYWRRKEADRLNT
jgi:hypothetical protein